MLNKMFQVTKYQVRKFIKLSHIILGLYLLPHY